MSDDRGIRLRHLAPDETQRLFSFYRETLGSAERVIALYEWRVRGSPASGGIDTYVAEREDRLVGAMNAVPVRLSSGGRLLEAAWQQDSIVHPDCRGRGVGSRLVSYAAGQAPLALAKGTVPPMYRLRKKMGFVDVPRDTYLLRPMTPVARGPKASWKRRTVFPALWLAGQVTGRMRTRLETIEIDRFGAGFDRLAGALAERPGLRVRKPADYLNWRYFACPIRRYRVFAALRGREPAGAVVLRVNESPGEDAWLVDLIVDEGDAQAVHALVSVAIQALVGSGAGALRTFATCPRLRRLLVLRGFAPTSETPRFTYHLAAEGWMPNGEAWSFFHGDGDTELLD